MGNTQECKANLARLHSCALSTGNNQSMFAKVKRLFFIVLVNIAILGFGIVSLELIFGGWLNSQWLARLNLIRDATITYDITGLYESTNNTVLYTRDVHGLRGSFNDPSEINILTVGGSTTDQRYINDGETWQAVMQQEFEAMGKEIVVANAGVDGQSTFGHIKNFEWWFPHIPNLKPQFILFYIGLNDFYKDAEYKYDGLETKEKRTIRHIFRENSALYYFSRTLRNAYGAMFVLGIGHSSVNFADIEWTEKPLQTGYDEIMAARLKAYAKRLTILVNKTKQLGSIPIFVTQPYRKYRFINGTVQGIAEKSLYENVEINGVDYYHLMKKLDAVTLDNCQQNGEVCIDMAKDTLWENEDFYDFTHMTPKGARKVGVYLVDKLKDVK